MSNYKCNLIQIPHPLVPIAHLFSFLQGEKAEGMSNLKIYYSFLAGKKASIYFSKLSIEMSSRTQGSLLSLSALDTQRRNISQKCIWK